MKHLAANCTLFDEEKIEFLNAKVNTNTGRSRLDIDWISPVPAMLADWPVVQPENAER